MLSSYVLLYQVKLNPCFILVFVYSYEKESNKIQEKQLFGLKWQQQN
jgi:hypothetical protein